ncbi:hypothetical protein [Kaistella faecalis]|uniref:hypothetical protein n=1 Tax=Kaistella faecalis TaxID=2852098 RepID=UPI001C4826A7|nr:hypothetical protein [Chryseobacterium faecale]UFK97742.1 hypothetical protein LL667_12390 [Chryseobacterium faecale]
MKLTLFYSFLLGSIFCNAQTFNYSKCIANATQIPLSKIKKQIQLNREVSDLKKLSPDKDANDIEWTKIKNSCNESYGDHPDFKESELYNRFFNSIGASRLYDSQVLITIAPNVIKQYVCLKNNYGLRYDIEPEFLSEEEYFKKYPNPEDNYDPTRYSFMQSLMNKGYNYRLAAQKQFPKCITKKEVDW